MKIHEALKTISDLQYLIGTKPDNFKSPITDIIPAPNDDTFNSFLDDYLYTDNIDKTIQLHRTSNFEILLIFKSKTDGAIANAWYKELY